MIRFQKMTGVEISSGSSTPQITRTPEGIAMGPAPGWALFLDPDQLSGATIRNRARRDNFTDGTNAPTTTVSGQTFFNPQTSDTMSHGVQGVAIDPQKWTVFFVAQPEASSSFQRIVGRIGGNSATEFVPYVGFATNGNAFQVLGPSGTRISHSGAYASLSDPALFIAHFSVQNGLGLRVNGEEVASEPGDTNALTDGFGAGEWECFRFVRGLVGYVGLLNSDLGASENRVHLNRVEDFIMQKYGIS